MRPGKRRSRVTAGLGDKNPSLLKDLEPRAKICSLLTAVEKKVKNS
jgi:hypothetical protein